MIMTFFFNSWRTIITNNPIPLIVTLQINFLLYTEIPGCESPAITGRRSGSALGYKALSDCEVIRLPNPDAGLMVFKSSLSILMANKMDPRPAAIIGSILLLSWSLKNAQSS